MHGFVGAGKTTFAKRLEREKRAVRYSHDEWMRERFGSNPPADRFAEYYAIITEDIKLQAAERLSRGQDVILDFGFWKRADRDAYRDWAAAMGVDCVLYHVYADAGVMRARVLARTEELPDGQLAIDEHAIDLFRTRFESLEPDEAHIAVCTG
jgi:predicted kinase